ncbi:unnamed protein product [Chrysoparadoxa australica]
MDLPNLYGLDLLCPFCIEKVWHRIVGPEDVHNLQRLQHCETTLGDLVSSCQTAHNKIRCLCGGKDDKWDLLHAVPLDACRLPKFASGESSPGEAIMDKWVTLCKCEIAWLRQEAEQRNGDAKALPEEEARTVNEETPSPGKVLSTWVKLPLHLGAAASWLFGGKAWVYGIIFAVILLGLRWLLPKFLPELRFREKLKQWLELLALATTLGADVAKTIVLAFGWYEESSTRLATPGSSLSQIDTAASDPTDGLVLQSGNLANKPPEPHKGLTGILWFPCTLIIASIVWITQKKRRWQRLHAILCHSIDGASFSGLIITPAIQMELDGNTPVWVPHFLGHFVGLVVWWLFVCWRSSRQPPVPRPKVK